MTKHHKLSGLNNRNVFQALDDEVQNQGVGRAMFPLKTPGKTLFQAFFLAFLVPWLMAL